MKPHFSKTEVGFFLMRQFAPYSMFQAPKLRGNIFCMANNLETCFKTLMEIIQKGDHWLDVDQDFSEALYQCGFSEDQISKVKEVAEAFYQDHKPGNIEQIILRYCEELLKDSEKMQTAMTLNANCLKALLLKIWVEN